MSIYKKLILAFFYLSVPIIIISLANALAEAYEINLAIKNDSFYLKNFTKTLTEERFVYGPFPMYENIYFYEIYSSEGDFLKGSAFSFSPFITVHFLDNQGKINGVEIIKLENINLTLYVPYYSNAEEIRILDNTFKELIKLNLTDQEEEKVKEIVKSASEIKPSIQKQNKSYLLYLNVVSITILLIIVFIIVKRKRDEEL